MKLFVPIVAALASVASSAQQPTPAPLAQGQNAAAPSGRVTVAALDAALQRGARWLREQQRESGAFEPESKGAVCPVAMTAMALWSLNQPEPRLIEAPATERATAFLLANRRPEGGIYDPSRGLAVYTTGVAARALRTLGKRPDIAGLADALAAAELYTYRAASPESIVDAAKPGDVTLAKSAEVARSLLDQDAKKDEARRKALEFLARCERNADNLPSRLRGPGAARNGAMPGAFSYDDLLPFVYFDIAPEQQIALRAQEALRNYYTPDRNPDLTKRYGPEGFGAGTQGRFYYYFVAAKALSTFSVRTLVTADGASHDWADELGSRLAHAQRPDGSWSNADPQWWEGEPLLATSYALLTLKLCRARLVADGAK